MREGHAGYISQKDIDMGNADVIKAVAANFQSNDVTALHGVEIDVRHDEQVIWISVDGVTRLRIIRNPLTTTFEVKHQ